jgi:hypothetical protein
VIKCCQGSLGKASQQAARYQQVIQVQRELQQAAQQLKEVRLHKMPKHNITINKTPWTLFTRGLLPKLALFCLSEVVIQLYAQPRYFGAGDLQPS